MIFNLNKYQYIDALCLTNNLFFPLLSFCDKENFISITNTYKDKKKNIIGFPVFLDANEKYKLFFQKKKKIFLYYKKKKVFKILNPKFYSIDKKKYVKKIFGTNDIKHPGVKRFLDTGKYFISGNLLIINDLNKDNFINNFNNFLNKNRIERPIACFHTRNLPHRGHEFQIRMALKFNKSLIINPLFGVKKIDDFKNKLIQKSYSYLEKKSKIYFFPLMCNARYSGPRESLMHCLIRKNLGFDSIIIGRDHAGVGSYYKKYDSQKLCKKFEKKLIKVLDYKEPFYCVNCKKFDNKKFKHNRTFLRYISGTLIRFKIKRNLPIRNYELDKNILKIIKNEHY